VANTGETNIPHEIAWHFGSYLFCSSQILPDIPKKLYSSKCSGFGLVKSESVERTLGCISVTGKSLVQEQGRVEQLSQVVKIPNLLLFNTAPHFIQTRWIKG